MTQDTQTVTSDSIEAKNGNTVSADVPKTNMEEGSTASKEKSDARAMQTRVNANAMAFGEIVAMLSRSPLYRHMSLADLEWLVVPALITNQVTTVRGKLKEQQGLTIPLGLALWANVSEDVDKKLEAQKEANIPFRLAPQDWKSGEMPWLLAVVGPKEVTPALVKKLETTVFKDQPYKRFAQEVPKVETKSK